MEDGSCAGFGGRKCDAPTPSSLCVFFILSFSASHYAASKARYSKSQHVTRCHLHTEMIWCVCICPPYAARDGGTLITNESDGCQTIKAECLWIHWLVITANYYWPCQFLTHYSTETVDLIMSIEDYAKLLLQIICLKTHYATALETHACTYTNSLTKNQVQQCTSGEGGVKFLVRCPNSCKVIVKLLLFFALSASGVQM